MRTFFNHQQTCTAHDTIIRNTASSFGVIIWSRMEQVIWMHDKGPCNDKKEDDPVANMHEI